MGGRRRALVVLSPAVAALAVCAPARAATVGEAPDDPILGPTIAFVAADGEANDLAVSSVDGEPEIVVFTDAGAPIAPGPGCEALGQDTAVCRIDGLSAVDVRLRDSDDRLDASELHDQGQSQATAGLFSFAASGGEGEDLLTGAVAFSCLDGDGDDDVLTVTIPPHARDGCAAAGGGGRDRLLGTEVADILVGGGGPDLLLAGTGDDQAFGGGGRDRLELGSGNDAGEGGSGDDRILGGAGNDRSSDGPGADRWRGGPGDDRIFLDFRTVAGADHLSGGPGSDTARFLCPSCQASLNGRRDDGERGARFDDDLELIESLVTQSSRFAVAADRYIRFGPGDDRLSGDRKDNLLKGTRGADLIAGAGGNDRLVGGRGPDRLRAADGQRDEVDCGSGRDRAVVDGRDRVRGCERSRIAQDQRRIGPSRTPRRRDR